MRQLVETMTVGTRGRGLHQITGSVLDVVRRAGMRTGLLTLWCRHTSASLLVTENASPEVLDDMEDWVASIAPEDATRYRHDLEGPDDMPAHLRAALTGVQLTIPVDDATPLLGTWQGIFLYEHRSRPHRREIALHLLGA